MQEDEVGKIMALDQPRKNSLRDHISMEKARHDGLLLLSQQGQDL
jgi:hypothetical protein